MEHSEKIVDQRKTETQLDKLQSLWFHFFCQQILQISHSVHVLTPALFPLAGSIPGVQIVFDSCAMTLAFPPS